MISFEAVNKEFKVDFWDRPFKALSDLSFRVPEGSIVGFLGANGAGKTTALKILMGFIPYDSGKVWVDPRLGERRQEILSKIGFLPERPYFYPHLTGRELAKYLGALNNIPKQKLASDIRKWSEFFKIGHALDRKINTYSKGMLQRIGFVITLLHGPEVIILDEPLSGLDPIGRKELKDAIVALNKEGKTIFFSSHIVSDVQEICHWVVFIEKGSLVSQGPMDDFLQKNSSPLFEAKLRCSSPANYAHIGEGHVFGQDLIGITLEKGKVDELLRAVTKNQDELIYLSGVNMSLEEVIYKVKNRG